MKNNDTIILRELAKTVKEISSDPIMEDKKELWYRHNSLKGERPLIFVHPDGAWSELLPIHSLECENPTLKEIEYDLKKRIIRHRYVPDDVPCNNEVYVKKEIRNTMWGIDPIRDKPINNTGAWHHHVMMNTPSDWSKLKHPDISHNEEKSKRKLEIVKDCIGDILPVELVGVSNLSFHLMHWYCDYRGLENLYTDLYDDPEMVHEVMTFFTEGIEKMLVQYEEQNLLSLNNNSTFHYTGGIGYTHELPADDYDPNKIRLKDLWAAAEAQELSQVSPQMHEEFALQYERRILSNFGLNGYGCCDDLGKKLKDVLKIKNLRRVAISPWADISDFVGALEDKYLLTWKPNPTYLALTDFNSEIIENELRNGLEKSKGCKIELILRDTHTCRNEPERFIKWVKIARKVIREIFY